jgi:uncharacterized protein (DUF305 family)
MSCKILSKDKISDKEFLELMIKHHNVAVKMSEKMFASTRDDIILDFARRTIYNQSQEINLMERLLKTIPNIQNSASCLCQPSDEISTEVEKAYPGIFSNTKCQESHFDYSIHMTSDDSVYEEINKKDSISHHPRTSEEEYIQHMLDHHKSGIELAKLISKCTPEPKILNLAQNIIINQEKEAFHLATLSNSVKYNWRKAKF